MALKLEFNFDPASLDEINYFELNHKIVLPEDYKIFLTKYNGGKPVVRRFETIDGKHTTSLMLLYPFSQSYTPNVISTYKEISEGLYIPSNIFVIGNDPIDNKVCVSISGDDNGAVYYWSMDMEEFDSEDFSPSYKHMSLVAKSFTEFLDKLFSPED